MKNKNIYKEKMINNKNKIIKKTFIFNLIFHFSIQTVTSSVMHEEFKNFFLIQMIFLVQPKCSTRL